MKSENYWDLKTNIKNFSTKLIKYNYKTLVKKLGRYMYDYWGKLKNEK